MVRCKLVFKRRVTLDFVNSPFILSVNMASEKIYFHKNLVKEENINLSK